MNQRCNECLNCKRVNKTRDQMLAISAQFAQNIHGAGHDDGTIAVWNDTLRDYPCTGAPERLYCDDPRADQGERLYCDDPRA